MHIHHIIYIIVLELRIWVVAYRLLTPTLPCKNEGSWARKAYVE